MLIYINGEGLLILPLSTALIDQIDHTVDWSFSFKTI